MATYQHEIHLPQYMYTAFTAYCCTVLSITFVILWKYGKHKSTLVIVTWAQRTIRWVGMCRQSKSLPQVLCSSSTECDKHHRNRAKANLTCVYFIGEKGDLCVTSDFIYTALKYCRLTSHHWKISLFTKYQSIRIAHTTWYNPYNCTWCSNKNDPLCNLKYFLHRVPKKDKTRGGNSVNS